MTPTQPRNDPPGAGREQPPATLRVVCAWCQRLLSGDIDAPVSHGICAACTVDVEFQRERLDDFLNSRTPQGPVWKSFAISTERVGTLVLLRIEGGAVDTSGRVWH